MNKIYILLPVHNRKAITQKFIKCLCAQTFKNYYLVLIDDGSTDGTEEMVRSYVSESQLSVIKGNGNLWWAGSLQKGINWLKKNASKGSVVLFINDDVLFLPDYLEQACRVMTDKKGVLMLSQFLNPESNKISESGVCADLKKLIFKGSGPSDKINCLSTRGLFVYWEDVKVIGDFHPKLLPHYLSDYEYTIRAYRKGLKCETSSQLLIEPDFEETGFHIVNEKSFFSFLKKYFSKKSASNPFYWTSFVLLVSPISNIPMNLMRVWFGAGKSILKALCSTGRL